MGVKRQTESRYLRDIEIELVGSELFVITRSNKLVLFHLIFVRELIAQLSQSTRKSESVIRSSFWVYQRILIQMN